MKKIQGVDANYQDASDKLVIANSNTTTPLVDGDFSAATLNVNGAFTANSVAAGDVSSTEFGYLDGVTSSIQDQINANVNQVTIDGGNLSVGTATMNTNEGADNTVFGSGSMYTNTSGSYNTAIGRYSLTLNTTGDRNNGLGNNSLYNNTTGSYNVGIGNYALFNNTTAGSNVAVGDEAMFSNLSGSNNTAIGGAALRANTTGGENSAFGYLALKSNTTGTRNTALGLSTLFITQKVLPILLLVEKHFITTQLVLIIPYLGLLRDLTIQQDQEMYLLDMMQDQIQIMKQLQINWSLRTPIQLHL